MDCNDAPPLPDVSDLGTRPTDGCLWCLGHFDGFMAGDEGIDPAGNRYDLDRELRGKRDYEDGVESGLARRRVRDQLAAAA